MILRRAVLALGLLASACLTCHAGTINLGILSFDTFIPAGAGPGVNVFSLNNFTGDPYGGGFALPPDFPVVTSVVFRQASLLVTTTNSSTLVSLGDLAPGSYTPSNLLFPDTLGFISAVLTVSLDPGNFILSGGTSFTPQTFNIQTSLLPSSGTFLQPGIDFALISVDVKNIPEPATWLLLAAGLAAIVLPRKLFSRPRVH